MSSLKPWSLEITSMVVSILTLVAMAVLLAHFDRQPIFDGKIWTLNAFVSALSTASKSTLLTVVASCISQGNWILFSDAPRRLYDFEMVSEASRGPLGSLKVLVSRGLRGAGLVRLGALATILTLAMDPFSQQLVQLHQSHRVDSIGSSIKYASRYSLGSLLSALVGKQITRDGHVQLASKMDLYADADFAMQAAVVAGLTKDREVVQQRASFYCPGPSCDFEPYESLAVCSRCSDLTDKLVKNNRSNGAQFYDFSFDQSMAEAKPNSTEYRLPNGVFLNNMNERSVMVYMTMKGTSDPNGTVTMSTLDTLIWSQTVIKVDADPNIRSNTTWPNFDIRASECALYYCVMNYTAKAEDGRIKLSATELEDAKRDPDSWALLSLTSDRNKIAKNVLKSIAYHPQDGFIDRTDLQLRRPGAVTGFNISQAAVYGISHYMQSLFAVCLNSANCTQALEDWDVPNGFYTWKFKEEYRPSAAKVFWEADDLGPFFENIAASMSNALRDGADGDSRAKGDIVRPTTVYIVAWPWTILHCVTELGAVVLLVLTIWSSAWRSGAVPVWKSSELAIFSNGAGFRDVFKGAWTMYELGEHAKRVLAMLVSSSPGPGAEGFPLVDWVLRREDIPPRESETGSLDSRNKTLAHDVINNVRRR